MLTSNYCVFKILNPGFEYLLKIIFLKVWGNLKPEDCRLIVSRWTVFLFVN